MTHGRRFAGWGVFWTATAALAAMALLILANQGWGTEGYRMVIRATARTSLAFFLAAFLASSLVALWPGGFTRWLRGNRRYVGLSFGMSHAIHLAAIVTLARTDPATFATLSTKGSIVTGSIGYVFIALLVVTSFDRMVAWLGPKLWQRVQTTGVWTICIFFFFTNGKRIPTGGWYVLPVAILFAALIIRFAARRKKASATADPMRQLSL